MNTGLPCTDWVRFRKLNALGKVRFCFSFFSLKSAMAGDVPYLGAGHAAAGGGAASRALDQPGAFGKGSLFL